MKTRVKAVIVLTSALVPLFARRAQAQLTIQAQDAMFGLSCTDEQEEHWEPHVGDDAQGLEMARCVLDYYLQRLSWPDLRPRRLRLVHWIVENHPDLKLGSHLPNGLRVSTADSDYPRIRESWIAQADRFPNNAQVLSNAADGLGVTERELAAKWLKRARELEPHNDETVRRLATLYSYAIAGVSGTGWDLLPAEVDSVTAQSRFARLAWQEAGCDPELATWTGMDLRSLGRLLERRGLTSADLDSRAEELLLRAATLRGRR